MIAGEDFVSQIKRSTIQSQISQSSQIKIISQLNVKAHVQASQKEPETVVKEITRQAKIDDLITHLISSWLWKKNVYKLVKKCLESDSIRHYFLMYHEASVINLLELVLFDKKACNFEYVIDVIDYIYDKIVFLNENNETSDEFQVIEQRIAFSSLSVLRYITDSISSESLFTTRLLFDYDFIILLVNLIETAPWLKRSIKNNTKIIEKFDQNEWKQVIGDDINVICKIEAQVWLTLYNLFLDPSCQAKYSYHTNNHATVLRLRSYMTQDLITQLPLLEGLYRYLEQLSMMEVPNEPQSRPKIHQIPELTSQLLENSDWKEIAKKQEMEFKGESKETVDKMVNELSKVFNTDDLEKFLDDPRCAKCGELAMQRCSRCKSEWYCGRACQVSAWVDHKNICDMMQGMENVKVT